MDEKEPEPARGHRTVTPDAIATFGALTGDYSRIHVDAEAGRAAGYGGPIAHGLLTASWALGALSLHAPEELGIGDSAVLQRGLSIRLQRVVRAGDTLSVRWSPGVTSRDGPPPSNAGRSVAFETLNQRGETTCTGRLEIGPGPQARVADPPTAWPVEPSPELRPGEILYAEDLLERGPRGETLGRTLTESEIVQYARHVGELNPLYLDEVFARGTASGRRIAPPMLVFCLAFADFLRELLKAPMPDQGFAGHVGDHWRWLAPVHPGDTLRTRHRPLACEPSRSRPERAIVRFGLQVLNQDDVLVQDGETVMLIPARPDGAGSSSLRPAR